jgi:hypothetical protein
MGKASLVILTLALSFGMLGAGCGHSEIATPTFTPSPTQSVVSTATDTHAVEIVQDLVTEKLDAMEAKDIARYLVLIDETDEEFFTEQRNWFLYYLDAITSDLSIEVMSAAQIDYTTIVTTLNQRYHYGPQKEDRTVTYAEKYVLTPNGWKDADLDFRVHETPHFLIKYTQGVEARAVEVGEQAEIAHDSVGTRSPSSSTPTRRCFARARISGSLTCSVDGGNPANRSRCMRTRRSRLFREWLLMK